jgi:riboflavin kinase/FMN adenylyltransferase
MQIICNPARIGRCALAIGNFDGVHVGHKAIIAKTREVAVSSDMPDMPVAVMTFEPHPRQFFQKEKAPKRITPFKQKMQLLAGEGVDICYVIKFNRYFASIAADDFMARYLRRALIVTGENFAFGADRGGDTTLLEAKLGLRYHKVSVLESVGEIASSSQVRHALVDGNLDKANAMLGHEFFVMGKVQHGAKNGAKLGFPTANIKLKPKQIRPKYGVYAVKTNYGAGVANFGVRPSFDGKTELLEVHIFNFAQDIYGQDLQVKFCAYIREEKFFDGIESLSQQITKDIDATQDFFK